MLSYDCCDRRNKGGRLGSAVPPSLVGEVRHLDEVYGREVVVVCELTRLQQLRQCVHVDGPRWLYECCGRHSTVCRLRRGVVPSLAECLKQQLGWE